MLQDLHFGDFAAADRHRNFNLAVQTGAGAFIDAVCRLRHSGDAAQHHDQRKKQGKELTHDRNPPFFLVVRSSNLLVQLEKRITISV